ncbi:MFS transporter [Cupriavidus necator]|uniref:MFS transporter n=1 Tax=Cupriavidus necator TaxID=106590 RepID=UPI003ECFBE4D
MFFWGYCLFEVPSNIALARFGARVWIARIMVMWGAASLAMAWVWSPESYYVLRFLLGVAEAGFVPGVIYYFRLWFPERYNNRMIGLFLLANPLSALIGNPLSGLLLQMDGILGMKGWQWLFIIESVPTILFGIVIFLLLPNSPRAVNWLAPAEKEWLENTLERERIARQGIKSESVAGVLLSARIWVLSSIYLGIVIGIYGVGFFLPQIVKEFGLSTASVGRRASSTSAQATIPSRSSWPSDASRPRSVGGQPAISRRCSASDGQQSPLPLIPQVKP